MNRLRHWMMTTCLVLMGVAMLIVLWRGNPFGSSTWLLLVPMGLCLVLHFYLHRHSQDNDD
ncbi:MULTISPECIES: hypothetical protein [Vreelandella]|uniref:DUF2933 domain-containing protein n=2 Tax=Vreelandella TaxID=3137766 RepID=A0A7C9JU90_9GAMM|nr:MULTISPECIES: hypothetical protein [Halomonas]NDL69138.1 hypothetical protein [Halomonas alkaliphila]NYS44165.1 hypothetical protein [Halomonas zhaodongensis]